MVLQSSTLDELHNPALNLCYAAQIFLLRDNQESGPYTIDELLLQRLTSTDLVWVPGRTNAWCHPSELEEFTVTYSVNREKLREIDPGPEKQNTPRRPKRSGRGEIESRAEEIRQNIL